MSLNIAQEPKKTRNRYPFEPEWGTEGAKLPQRTSSEEEPLDRTPYSELAKPRTPQERFVGATRRDTENAKRKRVNRARLAYLATEPVDFSSAARARQRVMNGKPH